MPKTWSKGDAKKFCRQLELGKTYYIIRETNTSMFPLNDRYLAVTVEFTGRLPFTNNPCTSSGYSAEDFCRLHGPVYDTPPPGVRNVEDRLPSYAPNVSGVHADAWLAW